MSRKQSRFDESILSHKTYSIGGRKPDPPKGPIDDEVAGFSGDKLSQDFLSRQPDNLNPLLPTYFQFSMKRCPHLTFFCQGANLPDISMTLIEQPTRFVEIPHSPGPAEFGDLSVNFLVDEEMSNWLEIYDWIRSATNSIDHKEYIPTSEHYTDATLTILNSSMNAKIRVEFHNCLPMSLSGLDFDSTTPTPEPLVATASFRYTNYEITKLS